ncbi:MAG: hypothetical protein ACLUMK_13745, partial [Christensenellales bacterium]
MEIIGKQKAADGADITVRVQDRRQMPARNIENLRMVHQSDEILLHFRREEILIGQDEKNFSRKRCKTRRCHGLLVHKIGKKPGDMHVLFLWVILENRLKHILRAGNLRCAFAADVTHAGMNQLRLELFIVAALPISFWTLQPARP